MRSLRPLFSLLVPYLAVACAGCGSDRADAPPPGIDYGAADAWLARPDSPSPAGLTPKGGGFTDLQASARADVFYVHPTTGMGEGVENVPIDDAAALEMGQMMVMAQATPFNAVARIFAPRYRQIALPVYERGEDRLQEPMSRAYADVRSAFDYYMTHYNGGRPFFLAAHSQGSEHALRLLSEAIQGTPLEQRMVAAYLPGAVAPRSYHVFDISLFWVDLRNNARLRLNAFLIGHEHATYPLFAAPASAAARVGSAFRFEVQILNGPAALTARGLPPGLLLDADAGVIAGTPEGAGVFPVVLTATNENGSSDAELALTVEESGG